MLALKGNRFSVFLLSMIAIILAGCATPQQQVKFSQQSLGGPSENIAVLQSNLPTVSVTFPGADCLLCIGAAMATHSQFRDHTKTLTSSDLQPLQDAVVARLRAKGLKAAKIATPIEVRKLNSVKEAREGHARQDFSQFAKEGYTTVVVIDIKQVGFRRKYASYIPTEPMKAGVTAEVYMVQLSDNKLLWFDNFDLSKGLVGEWDAPPKFPEITNAYFSLIEEFKDSVIEALK